MEAYRPIIRANIWEDGGGKLFIFEHEMFSDEEVVKLSCDLSSSSFAIVPGMNPIIGIYIDQPVIVNGILKILSS